MEDIAADDDLLSDMLLDSLEFEPPISTHKMNQSYRSPRYDTASVVDLVRKRIVCERDAPRALEELCDMSVVKKHLQGKSSRQAQAFMSHARRYLEAYLPDSGFEFAVTNRYSRSTAPLASSLADASAIAESSAAGAAAHTQSKGACQLPPKPGRGRRSGEVIAPLAAGSKADLCVVAVRDIAVGEIVPCKGGVKDLSKGEDEALRNEAAANRGRSDEKYGGVLGQGRDFSIIKSSMRNCSQLLLGPARFVNHDCNPSVQFYRSGQQMMFKVLRSIAANEEILVAYGDHYFGWENSECLCATCEARGRGAFTKEGVESLRSLERHAADAVAADDEQSPEGGRRAPSKRLKPQTDKNSPGRVAGNGNGASRDPEGPSHTAPDSQYANLAKRKFSSRSSSSNRKITTVASDRELTDPLAALGPKCKCITCGGPFYAPEAWWLPEECTRCERHYRVYKADWPCRIPEEPYYADLYQRAQNKRKANGSVGSEDGGAPASGSHAKSKAKEGTADHTSPPPPKKRGRPKKNIAPVALTATNTPSLPSAEGSTQPDSPIRLSPLRPTEGDESQTITPRALSSMIRKMPQSLHDKNGPSDLAAQQAASVAPAGPPFSDSGSDLTEASSLAVTEASTDPAMHGISGSSTTSSTSTSGSDGKPIGPKMLGKEAKTEALARFWGIGEGEGAKRLRKPSMNGPVSLAGKVGKQLSGSHRRSGSGVSAVSVFEADSDEDEQRLANEQRRKHDKSASREIKAGVGGSTPKAAVAEATNRSSRASTAVSDAKPSSHVKASPAGDNSSPRPPPVVGKDSFDDSIDELLKEPTSPVAQTLDTAQALLLATHGTARTSIKNLAAFWSAGVDAGSRTRKQTHREPTLLCVPTSSAVSSPKRGRESSGSQPPSGGVSGETKRQRSGGRKSRGGDDDSSTGGRAGGGRASIKDGSPSSSDGRLRTPPSDALNAIPSPATEGSSSRPRSPLHNSLPRKEASLTSASMSAAHSPSPVAKASLETSSTLRNSSPSEASSHALPPGGGSPTSVPTAGPAAYRHIPGRKNLRMGRGASASRPLTSSSSPGTNSVFANGSHSTIVFKGKEKQMQVQPVVGTTGAGWPGVSHSSAGTLTQLQTAYTSPLAQVTKEEDQDDGIEAAPWATNVRDEVFESGEGDKMEIG